MPSHGVDIIDGIPIILRDGSMYTFHPGSNVPAGIPAIMKLGTYSDTTKKTEWNSPESMNDWLVSYRSSLITRSRK